MFIKQLSSEKLAQLTGACILLVVVSFAYVFDFPREDSSSMLLGSASARPKLNWKSKKLVLKIKSIHINTILKIKDLAAKIK